MKNIFRFLSFFLLTIPLYSDDLLLSGYSSMLSTNALPTVSHVIDSQTSVNIKDKYEWLVFVFINGVNDLGILKASVNEINEMESVGSSDRVAVVVEHNRIENKAEEIISFSDGAVTYFITKDRPNNPEIVSKIIDYTPDGDMGSYRHFIRSAKKAIKRFNPDKVVLILWNHGNGYFGIAYDDVSGNNITIPQLRVALSEISTAYGKKIDIFAMDACLMQMSEVVTELNDYARFIVASEELIPGGGFPYDDILNVLNVASSPKDASIGFVNVYHNAYDLSKETPFGGENVYMEKRTTISAIDSSKFSGFLNIFNQWISYAINSSDFKAITSSDVVENSFFFLEGKKNEVLDNNNNSILISDTENIMTRSIDLIDYLNNAKQKMKDENLKNITSKLIDYTTKSLVILAKGGNSWNSQGFSYKDRTYGLAIYFPKLRYKSQKYESLRFSKVSLWDDFLRKALSKENIDEIFAPKQDTPYEKDLSDSQSSSLETKPKFTDSNSSKSLISKPQSFNELADIKLRKSVSIPLLSNSASSMKISENITAKPVNIYSTIYTSNKTLKPDTNNLIGGKLRENQYNLPNITVKARPKKEEQKLQDSNFIDISKQLIENVSINIAEKIASIVETIFPDKEKRNAYEEKLKEFEVEISTNLSLTHSKKLIEDKNLQMELSKIDRNKVLKLISYANEIIEIDRIVSRNYKTDEINFLSKTLETMLDRSRLICELNLCIPPEKLSKWMVKNQKYKPENISNVEIAIRKWERIFREDPIQYTDWNNAESVKFTSTTWSDMSVRERNAALNMFIKKEISIGTTSSPLISLSEPISQQVKTYKQLSISVATISQRMMDLGILNNNELDLIKSKPLSEQVYILANLFDRGNLKSKPELLPYINLINAKRTSFTNEVINSKLREQLSQNISSSLKQEITTAQTGKILYNSLYSETQPQISIEYIEGESKNDGEKIVVNAALVEQFLRVKGYVATDLTKNKDAMNELVSYLSPLIVREMANIEISRNMAGYLPDVREKYAAALLYQAKYTKERMADENFSKIFKSFSGVSDYADKVMIVKRNYEQADNNDDFIQTVGLRYYANMPTSSIARDEMLIAITKELERRSVMSKDEKNRTDKYAVFTKNDIYTLSPFEITNYVKDIETDALVELQKHLISNSNFKSALDRIISKIN